MSSEAINSMKQNRNLQKIRNGEIIYGIMLAEIDNPEIILAIKAAGFDSVFIDLEHGAFSLESVKSIARICVDNEIFCFARVNSMDSSFINRIQDVGVAGIMLAHSEDPKTIQGIIEAIKYPPIGSRGFGVRGVHSNYEILSVSEKMTHLNQNSAIIIQIESQKGVQNIEDIAKIKHIDALFIGPTDLSISLGVPGQIDHDLVNEHVETTLKIGKKHNIPVGYYSTDPNRLQYWKDKGCTLLYCGTEISLMMSAGKAILSKLWDEK